jgi:hypothetical protein
MSKQCCEDSMLLVCLVPCSISTNAIINLSLVFASTQPSSTRGLSISKAQSLVKSSSSVTLMICHSDLQIPKLPFLLPFWLSTDYLNAGKCSFYSEKNTDINAYDFTGFPNTALNFRELKVHKSGKAKSPKKNATPLIRFIHYISG